MNTQGKIAVNESKTKITAPMLMRLAGLSATVAGLCAIVVGMFHPINVAASVTTPTWAIVHIFAVVMSALGLVGMVGLYVKQAGKAGWLGLVGYILLSLWFALMLGFTFAETFVLPHLATESPKFVESFLGMFTGVPGEVDLGVFPMVWTLTGPCLILGCLLFGIATFRAGTLPRWAGILLAVGGVLIPAGALIPAEHEAKVLLPMGLALTWLGYALLVERQEKAAAQVLEPRTIYSEPSKVA